MSRGLAWSGFAVRSALVCTLAWWAASNALASFVSDEGAARLNPLRTDLRAEETLRLLDAAGTPDASDLRYAMVTLRLAPGNPLALSAAAMLAERAGATGRAQALLAEVGRRAPLEWLALARRIEQSLLVGDTASAMARIDPALRRFPEQAEILFQAIAAIAAEDGGLPAIVATLGADPDWQGNFLRWAVAEEPDVALAVMLGLQKRGGEIGSPRSRMVDALVARRRHADARRFLALTAGRDERAAMGLVNDPRFALGFASHVLGWRHFESAEVGMSTSTGGLHLKFRDRPAKLGNLRQVLVVPPGPYRFEVEASASHFRAPVPLSWTLACIDDWRQLARLEILPGNHASRSFAAALDIPVDCPVQQITLHTRQHGTSAERPYSGSVTIGEVAIVPAR